MAFFGRPVASPKLRGVGFLGLDWVATQNGWGSPPFDTASSLLSDL